VVPGVAALPRHAVQLRGTAAQRVEAQLALARRAAALDEVAAAAD
jgi:hypothetical protein